jgi:hypothetical protein
MVPTRLLLLLQTSQIISDLLNHSPTIVTIKGFALIFFTLSSLRGMNHLLKRNDVQYYSALMGLSISSFLGFFIQPNPYAHQFVWKFGFSYGVNLILVLMLSRRGKDGNPMLQPWTLLILAGIDLVAGTRALAIFCVLTFAVIKLNKKSSIGKNADKKSGRLLISSVLALIVISFGYSTFAKSGIFGVSAQQKYFQQSSGKLGILVGGRPELVFTNIAIKNSPIIGYGSGAPLTTKILDEGISTLTNLGYRINQNASYVTYLARGVIPEHSAILGSWTNWGIFAVPFWAWCIYLCIKLFFRTDISSERLYPVAVFLAFNTLWAILFSPYGATDRFQLAVTILLLLHLTSTSREGR